MAENINLTLENLREAIDAFTEQSGQCCTSKGQDIESPPSDGEVSVGEDEQFPDQASYFAAKCNAANAIYDTIKAKVDWLRNNNVDLLAGVLGGVTTAVALGLLLSGPVGWAIELAAVTLIGLSTYLISHAIDFEDLQNALIDVHSELVLSLFNSFDTTTARNSFLTTLAASSVPTTIIEHNLIQIMLATDLLNLLFSPRQDVGVYQSPSPINCGSFILQVWSFEASGESWSFRDDSTGTYSASGIWSSPKEAWEINLVGLGTGTGPRAEGTVLITGLSIAVPSGSSVQMDHSATSDGVIGSRKIKVFYSDATDQTEQPSSTSTAGTVVLTVPVAKTISAIEISLGRNWQFAFDITRDVEEVRIIGT